MERRRFVGNATKEVSVDFKKLECSESGPRNESEPLPKFGCFITTNDSSVAMDGVVGTEGKNSPALLNTCLGVSGGDSFFVSFVLTEFLLDK